MGSQNNWLLKRRTFLPLFLTQFFGAFNDNTFKLAMLTLISYHLSVTQAASEYYQALSGALFILPFFLFSATAGQLADKYDKAVMTRIVKLFEVILMAIGSVALLNGSIVLMLLVLTGMGLHSTFFGPIKYAILPDHLPREELLSATALIEASTFIAILLGTTLGALSIGNSRAHVGYAIFLTLSSALIGLATSFFIPNAPSKSQNITVDWYIWRATKTMLRETLANSLVCPVVLTISWFWLIGAVMMTKLPDYTHYVLRADTSVFALFLALFSIGIALGSLAISRLLAGKITLGYVPAAMLLLSFFAIDLYWATPVIASDAPLQTLRQFLLQLTNLRITIDFFLFSFSGGLFVVPLYTFLQVSCNEGARARTIAANNIVNALAMVLGSLLVMALLKLKITITFVFVILAMLNIIAAIAFWIAISREEEEPSD